MPVRFYCSWLQPIIDQDVGGPVCIPPRIGGTRDFTDWAKLFSSFLSAAFVLWGVWVIRKSRLLAFKLFERSVLVSVFLTQVFVFYKEQFSALIGLAFDLLLLMALNILIQQEQDREME